jgi:hypothetical protein
MIGGPVPVVFRWKSVRFFFFSNEGLPRKPLHVHAEGPEGEAKFWLHPEVRVAASVGFNRRALSELVTVVEQRREEIERAWHEHFG